MCVMCVCVGGYFQDEGQEKILLCKGVCGHYMKNKNIGGGGGGVLSTQHDQQKRPQCKKRKKISNIKNVFPRSFRSLGILQNSYFWSS